jgi:hypothetical protein
MNLKIIEFLYHFSSFKACLVVSGCVLFGVSKQITREDEMTTTEKAKKINAIISHLRFHAKASKKAFDAGDTFLSLCFREDKEVERIAILAGV